MLPVQTKSPQQPVRCRSPLVTTTVAVSTTRMLMLDRISQTKRQSLLRFQPTVPREQNKRKEQLLTFRELPRIPSSMVAIINQPVVVSNRMVIPPLLCQLTDQVALVVQTVITHLTEAASTVSNLNRRTGSIGCNCSSLSKLKTALGFLA